ncbi:MAG: acyl--CoA ligase [Proteobacteria bacterium]|nr:acyl--CoA ligase [Pseudomonadota bacterium]
MGKPSPNFIANYLNTIRTSNPKGEVLVYGKRRVTWGEMIDRSYRLSNALIRLGVKKNDKIVFMFHNTPEFMEINFAAQAAGAIPTPMNYRFVSREIEYQVNHSDATVLIYDSRWREAVENAVPSLTKIKHLICFGEKGLDEALDYESLLKSGAPIDPEVATGFDDTAVMIYTGGTTGFPKGVMLSYGAHIDMFSNLFAHIVASGAAENINSKVIQKITHGIPIPGMNYLTFFVDKKWFKRMLASHTFLGMTRNILNSLLQKPQLLKQSYKKTIKYMIPSLPFFHDASYQIIFLGVITGNLTFLLPEEISFNPEKIFETIEKEKPVFLANVPTGWKKLVSAPESENYDLSSVRIAVTGAGAASTSLKRKIFKTFPSIVMVDIFGQTEMTPITTFRIDVSPENLKDRAVGKSIVKVKIVNDKGVEVPKGETGEILYQSSTIMKGYYKDEQKTKEAIKDGWFWGGDLGYIDEDGDLRLVDRKNECINTGGEKVFPLEVEEIIAEHPHVSDVCVIGVPDEEWGSTVRAVIVPKDGKAVNEAEIIDFCKGKLANYKICKSVVLTDKMPLSPVGKVLRAKIRDLYGNP